MHATTVHFETWCCSISTKHPVPLWLAFYKCRLLTLSGRCLGSHVRLCALCDELSWSSESKNKTSGRFLVKCWKQANNTYEVSLTLSAVHRQKYVDARRNFSAVGKSRAHWIKRHNFSSQRRNNKSAAIFATFRIHYECIQCDIQKERATIFKNFTPKRIWRHHCSYFGGGNCPKLSNPSGHIDSEHYNSNCVM